MRDFSTMFNQNVLRLILEQLNEAFDNSRYDVNTDYVQPIYETIQNVVSYFGVDDLTWDEGTFFCELVRSNPDYETEPIKVPSLSTYAVDVDVRVVEWVNETYIHKVQSYFPEELDSVKDQLMNAYGYAYWEGERTHREVYEAETQNEEVNYIEKIEDEE
jgi:hypothetical protein